MKSGKSGGFNRKFKKLLVGLTSLRSSTTVILLAKELG